MSKDCQAAMDAGQIRGMDAEVMAYCIMGIGDFLGMRWVLWDDDALPYVDLGRRFRS